MPPASSTTQELLAQAHIDALRENTHQLQGLRLEMSTQTHLMKGMVDKIGVADKRVAESESKITSKLSELITSIRVQWVIIGTGIVPVLYLVAKGWNT